MKPSSMTPSSIHLNQDTYHALFRDEYIHKCLAERTRPDGRQFDATRSVNVTKVQLSTAASASMAKIGRTTVFAGISLSVGTPVQVTPKEGEFDVQTHLTPLCSARYSLGRQGDESQSLSNLLKRILKQSKIMNLEELMIVEGKAAWKIQLDLVCIDHDGNLIDTAFLAAVHALEGLELPEISITEDDPIVVSIAKDSRLKTIQLSSFPIASTFALYSEKNIILEDPTVEEEEFASSIITIFCTEKGKLLSVHKAGGHVVEATVMQTCIHKARQRSINRSGLFQPQNAMNTTNMSN